jgi:starch-binding outer membrane protein, SusD/RagB family
MIRKFILCLAMITLTTVYSCSDFTQLASPVTQVSKAQIFSDDIGARSAIAGILSQMSVASSFAGGGGSSINVVAGLSSDDLVNYSSAPDFVALFNNTVSPTNSPIQANWNEAYSIIYRANSAIEGLSTEGSGVSDNVRKEVLAEARFIRAFCYFTLVNLFGDVPLITTTDYRINRVAVRTSSTEINKFIITDLELAERDLPLDFSLGNGERIHPNSRTATAMLARLYLYMGRWDDAEIASTKILSDPNYSLVNLNSVFLANSEEAIWQLKTANPSINTNEGALFVLVSTPINVGLSASVFNGFEANDGRKSAWTRAYTSGAGKVYPYAYKYKVRTRNQPVVEYYMLLRLAEQFLIRSEARIQTGDLEGGIDDLNVVRQRAELPSLGSDLTKSEALLAVENERRWELFAEMGHRWFDLKRTNRAGIVLESLKSGWEPRDVLFPIPQSEVTANPNLIQNQ